eukprot:scaffold1972_cov265-Chaetoceros_neogracile.AAC.30
MKIKNFVWLARKRQTLLDVHEAGDIEDPGNVMNELFDCDDVGDMHEYVGCLVENLLRPVECPGVVVPGTVLMPVADDANDVDSECWQTKFRWKEMKYDSQGQKENDD